MNSIFNKEPGRKEAEEIIWRAMLLNLEFISGLTFNGDKGFW